jgi:hypothetical protein
VPQRTMNPQLTDLGSLEHSLARLRADLRKEAEPVEITPLEVRERRASRLLRVKAEGIRSEFLLIKEYRVAGEPEREPVLERLLRDYAALETHYSWWKDSEKFASPRPVACYPDLMALVMEECRGEDLGTLLKRRGRLLPGHATRRELQRLMALAGEWVRAHQSREEIQRRRGEYEAGEYMEYIERRLRRLSGAGYGIIRQELGELIRRHARRLWDDLGRTGAVSVPIHGDYCPSNVMTDGAKLMVIDIGGSVRGSIQHDISRFYHQLGLFTVNPLYRQGVFQGLQRRLLDGFDERLQPGEGLFQLLLLRHTICHLLNVGRPEKASWLKRQYNRLVIRRHIRWLYRACNGDP